MENPTLPQQARRIAAVDVFRALTMFLMLFVNDIPGLRDVPHWLFPRRADEDMMGFSDTIFPAFLFCMGMAVPLAVQARYRKGDSPLQVVAHLFWRTLALIVMGLFTLNAGGVEGGLTYEWFSVLMVIGFFLTWAIYPKATGGRRLLYTAMKAAGIALLLFLVIYRDAHGAPFETGWWGILGLIGWTYAVCAVIYLFTGDNLRLNTIAWLVVVLLSVLNHMHEPPSGFAWQMLTLSFIPGDWTLHALGMSGVVATLLMQRYATPERPGRFAAILCALGAVMLILAPAVPPALDYLEDTGHAHLAVLLPGHVLPPVRPVLLADGHAGQGLVVPPHQARRHRHTDVLHPALPVVPAGEPAGRALPRRARCRRARTAEVGSLLARHRAAHGAAGEGEGKIKSIIYLYF